MTREFFLYGTSIYKIEPYIIGWQHGKRIREKERHHLQKTLVPYILKILYCGIVNHVYLIYPL